MATATAYDAALAGPKRSTTATAYDATVRKGPVITPATATATASAPFSIGSSTSLQLIGDNPVYAVAAAFAPDIVTASAAPIPARRPGLRIAAGAAAAWLATAGNTDADTDTAGHAGLGLEA